METQKEKTPSLKEEIKKLEKILRDKRVKKFINVFFEPEKKPVKVT